MSSTLETHAAVPESPRDQALFLAIISPDRQRRIAASGALARCGNVHTRDIEADAATLEEVRDRLGRSFDGVLIDLDGDPRRALALVEGLCIDSSLIVMVFSSRSDPELMLHAMRAVARHQFDNIVIDAGKKIDLRQMHLFIASATAYLVTQVGIPELRNANRLIAQFSADNSPRLEIVINRYQSRFLGLTDEHLAKALTRPVQWKIPNDFKAVSAMQSNGKPLVQLDSPIAAVLRKMADAACAPPIPTESKPPKAAAVTEFRIPWRAARGANAEGTLAATARAR